MSIISHSSPAKTQLIWLILRTKKNVFNTVSLSQNFTLVRAFLLNKDKNNQDMSML